MSISSQPNEMLDMILNQTGIPLAQRIRLRAVSHRFRATLEDGLQQENSLAIRVGSPSNLKQLKSRHSTVQPNDLIISVSNFTEKKAIDLIQRLFPNVTELTINSNSLIAWRMATELFDHFARTLTSLKVYGYLKDYSNPDSVFRSLGDAINSIVTLTSLHFDHEMLFHYFYGPSIGTHLLYHLAPTLSRLERFTFAKNINQNEANFIAASLSSRCTHLHLEFDDFVATFPLRDAINLTHLHLEYFRDTVLQFILQLPQLLTLFLFDKKWTSLDTLLSKIRPLSQVTQATFKIDYHQALGPPASKAFTFPSIKRLTLQLSYVYSSFKPIDYLSTLAIWFPNLTTCSLYVHERYREEILAIQENLPFTVELLDNFELTF